MNEYVLARSLHIIGVVLWIGGVAMVTTVILPSVRSLSAPEERAVLFESIEGRFAKQAKVWTAVTGASGFYMLYVLDGWSSLGHISHWWLMAMIGIWFLFTMMLYVLEPLFLHRWFSDTMKTNPEKTFSLMQRMHWILLFLSLVTVFGGVCGAHHWFFWLQFFE